MMVMIPSTIFLSPPLSLEFKKNMSKRIREMEGEKGISDA